MRLMTNHCNKLLALLLMLIVSHLPLRWEHTHQGLSGQQLVRHLQLYHPATPASRLPQGWHCHSDWPFALMEEECAAFPIQADSRIPYDINSLPLLPAHGSLTIPDRQWLHMVSPPETKYGRPTYILLNALLI
ncbi:hypothetical protein [uncultured Gimesia sp.]|jgi:hypothetical protein|uniref:hypothetical protein n=1 Tax=uncultured Gimesia sp. TaxID=1678688 RepID=UPI00260AC56E|nr:hypothetical protein [uncultured Gimesia sp.]